MVRGIHTRKRTGGAIFVVRRDGNLQGEGVLLEGMPIILRLTRRQQTTGFRGRKRQGGHIGKHLWDSTLFKTHYRSIHGIAASHSTPASATFGSVIKSQYDKVC